MLMFHQVLKLLALFFFEISDKRLKDNIEDVDEECSEIVKKGKVKTYSLKSDDKKEAI